MLLTCPIYNKHTAKTDQTTIYGMINRVNSAAPNLQITQYIYGQNNCRTFYS